MHSVVKVRKNDKGVRYVTIPKGLWEQVGDVRFLSADLDENGNLLYKPIRDV